MLATVPVGVVSPSYAKRAGGDEKMIAGLPIHRGRGFVVALRAHAVPIRQRRVGAGAGAGREARIADAAPCARELVR